MNLTKINVDIMLCCLIIFLLSNCTSSRLNNNNLTKLDNDLSMEDFKFKYKEFYSSDEKEVKSWYHYVTTVNQEGKYIHRTFFPETKQITSEVSYSDKKLKQKEGLATYWNENGNLIKIGLYIKNKQHGIWKEYHRKTGKLKKEGEYSLGNKTGAWKTYDKNQRLIYEINFKSNVREGKFIHYDSLQNTINQGVYKADTIFTQSNNIEIPLIDYKQPYLSECKGVQDKSKRSKCSGKKMLEYVYKSIRYPEKARKFKIEGTAVIQFIIDINGSVRDITVVRGLNEDIKKECIRVVSKMPSFEAAIRDGIKVETPFTLPIKFSLD